MRLSFRFGSSSPTCSRICANTRLTWPLPRRTSRRREDRSDGKHRSSAHNSRTGWDGCRRVSRPVRRSSLIGFVGNRCRRHGGGGISGVRRHRFHRCEPVPMHGGSGNPPGAASHRFVPSVSERAATFKFICSFGCRGRILRRPNGGSGGESGAGGRSGGGLPPHRAGARLGSCLGPDAQWCCRSRRGPRCRAGAAPSGASAAGVNLVGPREVRPVSCHPPAVVPSGESAAALGEPVSATQTAV
jgi:hypothetical protein